MREQANWYKNDKRYDLMKNLTILKKLKHVVTRVTCTNDYWIPASPLEYGSFSRGLYVCPRCGKLKLTEEFKSWDVVIDCTFRMLG